jgi:enoyl-CoA hydratase/carnithine racemase
MTHSVLVPAILYRLLDLPEVQSADLSSLQTIFYGAAAILPRLVPLNVAKYLLFTGKTLSAKEMQNYGLVNEVVPGDQLKEAAQKLAESIAEKSPIGLRRMKEVANAAADKSRDAALQHEQVMMRKHLHSYDMSEGLRVFLKSADQSSRAAKLI